MAIKRRTLLVGVSSITVGICTVMGSSAFSRTKADRTVSVEVADDEDAYLALDQNGGGARSYEDGDPEKIKFVFPGHDEESGADGLGLDSVYEFDADAKESGRDGLFEIRNNGTETVEVYGQHVTDSALTINLYDVDDENRELVTRSDSKTLEPDTGFDAGLRIETFGASIGEFDETLTIVAE